jgi:heat shock protein HslJ
MIRKAFIMLGLILLSACSEASEDISETDLIEKDLEESDNAETNLVDPDLVETEWVLTSINGGPLLEGTNITMAFYPSELSGFAGCNGYGAPIEIHENNQIQIKEIASQAEGCIEPEGVLDQEREYLNILWNIKQFRIDGSVLTLSIPDSEQTLVYSLREPFETDPSLLDNTQWNLVPSDGFPLIDGSTITLSFSKGEIEGYGGCRDYVGEYVADGDKIVFPVMVMTSEICDDRDLEIQESKFTTWLELSTHYQILGDQLELHLATGEWLLFDRME